MAKSLIDRGKGLPEPLTRERALAMQDALICEYRKPAFQEKLRLALKPGPASPRTEARKKELQLQFRGLREEVGARFGFEASPEGVARSILAFTPDLRSDPEVAKKCHQMELLLYPKLQTEHNMKSHKASAKRRTEPDSKHLAEEIITRATPNVKRQTELDSHSQVGTEPSTKHKPPVQAKIPRRWKVIGGEKGGGIVVRSAEDLNSDALPLRLANGAVVKELSLKGSRLHYSKINGEGPDSGWVSVYCKGGALLVLVEKPELAWFPGRRSFEDNPEFIICA